MVFVIYFNIIDLNKKYIERVMQAAMCYIKLLYKIFKQVYERI